MERYTQGLVAPALLMTLLIAVPITTPHAQHAATATSIRPALEAVELESAPRPLGRLQERRARERGEEPKPTPGDRLQAYLARPDGNGL